MSSAATPPHDLGDFMLDSALGPSLPAHFYFHVPFCRSKCSYCDFASVSGAETQLVGAVFEAMRAQVRRYAAASLPGVVETVYVGGGTPSLHAEHVAKLLRSVRANLSVRPGAEVTVEANPDSLTEAAVEMLAEAGATRISVGVQSFDDPTLRSLGRIHSAEQALRACELVVAVGLELSVDLICGAPGEDVGSAWDTTLVSALQTGARHMSVYPLQVEDDTPLSIAVSSGLVEVPDEDQVAEMLVAAAARLSRHGVQRYEVANYAVPGHESAHNSAYWLGRPYAGIGPSAHGMLDRPTAACLGYLAEWSEPTAARVRFGEAPTIESWLRGEAASIEFLDVDEAAREDAMLGLRLVAGIDDALALRARVHDVLAGLEAEGLVEHVVGRWRTTERGWLLGNVVYERVWCAEQ